MQDPGDPTRLEATASMRDSASRWRRPLARTVSLGLLIALASGATWRSSTRALPSAGPDRELADDEVELLRLARRFPPEPRAAEEREFLVKLAEGSGLTGVRVRTLGGPGPELAEELAALSATARVHELIAVGDELTVAWLPARLRAFSRPSLVETLEIVPLRPHEVRLVARVAFPALDPLVAGLDRTRVLLGRVDDPPRPLAALLGIAGELAELPVGIVRFRSGSALEIEAVAGGRRAAADFESALARVGLRDVQVRAESRGGCLALTATAKLGGAITKPGEKRERESTPVQLLFSGSESLCAGEETTPVLRASSGDDAGAPLLRLRGARRGDALHLLEQATGHPWLGFGASEPRIDLDLAAPDLDAAIVALREAGAPLRRFGEAVLWAERTTAREPDLPYQGEPVTLTSTCVEVLALLQVLERMTALEIVPSPEVGGCIDVFATDRPWDELFEAALVVAELDYRIDGTRVAVTPAHREAHEPPPPRIARAPFELRWRPALDRIEAGELRLIGLLQDKASWRAFAEGPLGLRYELSAGSVLADARVEATDATGIRLARDGKTERLELP